MSEAVVTLETPKEVQRIPLVTNDRSLHWITENVSTIVEARSQ